MVSIIIPAYNAKKYISKTIESVLNQTYKNIEVIVINDGSTDNTEKIINEIAKNDERVKCHSQKNAGVSTARNKGLSLAKGEYIAFLDADDLWLSTFIEEKITLMKNDDKIGAVNSNVQFIDSKGDKLQTIYTGITNQNIPSLLNFRTKNQTTGPSGIMCRKKLVDKIGGFNPVLSNTADKMFYLELSTVAEIINIDNILWLYRYHDESMHTNIKNMVTDYSNFLSVLDKKSMFKSVLEKKKLSKYLYKICLKESLKQKSIPYTFSNLFKYILS